MPEDSDMLEVVVGFKTWCYDMQGDEAGGRDTKGVYMQLSPTFPN